MLSDVINKIFIKRDCDYNYKTVLHQLKAKVFEHFSEFLKY